ncbi:MAG: hypothetical protein DYH05_03655 [Acidobacteria bacterium ACB1]|nr:hypothetical protein [Acidobacteria bacterium ACB1]RIJ92233.1 MAG: hypothetical protein DCC44_08370 [Acidobacteriota bacterium]
MRPHFPRLPRFFLLITALVTGIFASNPSFARSFGPVSRSEKQSSLPTLDVVAIRLDFQESRRTDAFGNRFKYWAKVRDKADARVGRRAWDVFLVISPPGT